MSATHGPFPAGQHQKKRGQVTMQDENQCARLLRSQLVLQLRATACSFTPVGQAGLKRLYPEATQSLMTASLEQRQVAGKQPCTHSSSTCPMCQDPGGSQGILPKLRSAVVKPCPMRRHEKPPECQGTAFPYTMFQ